MKTHLVPAIRLTLVTLVLFGVIYPLLITGIASVTGANGGKGETIEVNGKVVGFEVIGQSFTSDKYFNGRPSAVGYNAAATGGSNKGPTNPDYLAQVEQRIGEILNQNPGLKREDIPVDMVTSSGGGLDPHISVQAAMIQVPRIAKVRRVPEDQVRSLVDKNTSRPLIGLLGPSRVNALRLNISLDESTTK
jgi:K+-transporting ATPase ATPase C chain